VIVSTQTDAVAVATAVLERRVTALDTCREALERASADELGAFWELRAEAAFEEAAALDERLDAGETGDPLAGVPVAVKDCFHACGMTTTCGVRSSGTPELARVDSTAVARLRSAGAIVVGKTAMHQLAWGMSGQAPGFPPCRNPVDPSRQPGGSSSGSAVAVGADVVPLALGTDSGGSVRLPAAWCGVVGYKPTFGLVPLKGCAPMAPSLDTGGVLARSVRDCRVAVEALAGTALTAASLELPRVGVYEAAFAGCDPGVEAAVREALAVWARAGAVLIPIELPWERRTLGAIYAAELAAAWGAQVEAAPAAFGADVHEGVESGRRVPAVEYLTMRATVERLRADAERATGAFDVLACPTSPITAPRLEAPDAVGLAGRNTRVFNGLGWPSISVPCGEANGLPVGLMLSASAGRDADVLAAAEAFVLASARTRAPR
jgi:aspartyl-tRNA(Asn)/glutamyl-tRNA(Gln) amidotransferase subunit A